MNSKCEFTYKHYRECLELALQEKYSFLTFREADLAVEKRRTVFMRHDIDANGELEHNVRIISGIESELGIRSTYFLRVHARYNLLCFRNYNVIKELIDMGHEIGLHLESDYAGLTNAPLEELIVRDRELLQSYFKIDIVSMSQHSYGKTGGIPKMNLQKLGIYNDAYDDFFFNAAKYISDSASNWREGCMCNFFRNGVALLQILTHPTWWFEKSNLENW